MIFRTFKNVCTRWVPGWLKTELAELRHMEAEREDISTGLLLKIIHRSSISNWNHSMHSYNGIIPVHLQPEQFNPFPALTLQSARDLNVPCNHKRSKALLLTQKNRILFKKEDVFIFRTKTLNPLPVRLKVLLHALMDCVFSVAFADYTRNRSPLQEKKKL
jgi:hypothetical protein